MLDSASRVPKTTRWRLVGIAILAILCVVAFFFLPIVPWSESNALTGTPLPTRLTETADVSPSFFLFSCGTMVNYVLKATIVSTGYQYLPTVEPSGFYCRGLRLHP